MGYKPRLGIVCGRCGRRREGIRHTCLVRSGAAARRSAAPKLRLDLGKCGTCNRPLGNPLTHVCKPRSRFKKRKRDAARREKERAREAARAKRKADRHEYQGCRDDDCKRSACVAWKGGRKEGYDEGFEQGYGAGFDAGLESCPGPHQGG